MLILRPRESIHHTDGGWFSAYWHFSFDFYNDPENTWFGDLRVFNDDTLVPGAIWPMHPHRDIEGITYVADGMFEHADSRGNGGVLPPGSVQRATLGSGMEHSEGNHSQTEPMRFIQMWIIPARRGLEPSIEQREFPEASRRGRWLPVLVPATGYGGPDAPTNPEAVTVHQDAAVYATLLDAGPGRYPPVPARLPGLSLRRPWIGPRRHRFRRRRGRRGWRGKGHRGACGRRARERRGRRAPAR